MNIDLEIPVSDPAIRVAGFFQPQGVRPEENLPMTTRGTDIRATGFDLARRLLRPCSIYLIPDRSGRTRGSMPIPRKRARRENAVFHEHVRSRVPAISRGPRRDNVRLRMRNNRWNRGR